MAPPGVLVGVVVGQRREFDQKEEQHSLWKKDMIEIRKRSKNDLQIFIHMDAYCVYTLKKIFHRTYSATT